MPNKTAKKILFTSGKGGVGKSTLAVCMARCLSKQDKKVLMIDCDVCLRSLDILLGLSKSAVYDWSDVLEQRCKPKDAVITKNGIYLIVAPNNEIEATEKQMKEFIKNYEEDYDYILIDSPAGVGRGFKMALAMAESALVVSTPDSVCVHSSCIAAQKSEDYGVSTRLVINKFKKSAVRKSKLLNIDSVIDETGVQLIGVVPNDEKFSQEMLNGIHPQESRKAVKEIERIILRLDNQQINLVL